MEDLAFLDAVAQAELVRRKEVKPTELAEAAIQRIERLNPTLNAVVTPMYAHASAVARSDGSLQGPFAGVPFLVKDLADLSGVRTTYGSAFTSDLVPKKDSEIATRFKQAGLVILGKTNTPEFGLLPTTEPKLFGPTQNPWDPSCTPGGSSGGAAAAVAAGLVPLAHGNDGGGSIRIPASCCGVFGFKPSRGRTPTNTTGILSEHALTRSVRDSAALLDAISGPEPGTPYWTPAPARPFLQEVGADPGRLRIGYSLLAPTGASLHADCVSAVTEAAALCADLGHAVDEAAPTIDGALMTEAFMKLWAAGCAANLESLANETDRKLTPDQFETLTWALYETGRRQSAVDFMHALKLLHTVAQNVARFFTAYDVWLTPTLGAPPVALGAFEPPPGDPMAVFDETNAFVPFTPIANVTGQPAMSVPLHWNTQGVPIGAHFVGRFAEDATLFRLAAQLEEARPWAGRRPPLSA